MATQVASAGQAVVPHSWEQAPPSQAMLPSLLRSGMHTPVAHSRFAVQAEPSGTVPAAGQAGVHAPVAASQTKLPPQLQP